MQKSRFQISLYVLIPIIFSGITVFAVIVTYQLVDFYTKYQIETSWMLRSWGIGIALFTFLCALLVTWVILRPIKPEDEPMWHELLGSCSTQSIWFRWPRPIIRWRASRSKRPISRAGDRRW